MALWPGSFLPSLSFFIAGHRKLQEPQPVQSSGATWRVNFRPFISLPLASTDLKVAGASLRSSGS
jgi:hypothetical protein